MFSKVAVGQLAGFLFLFILVTSIVSQFMAGDPIDSNDVPKTSSPSAPTFSLHALVWQRGHFCEGGPNALGSRRRGVQGQP